MKYLKYFPVLILVIVLLGCSLSVNVPSIDTGTTQELKINQPVPSGVEESSVAIEMAAGKLSISEGSPALIDGSILYNVSDWKPSVTETTNGVLISQKHTTNVGVPNGNIKNDWTLKLGKTPIALKIDAGAYEGTINLSGLSIANLEINDGASKATVRFDSVNPVQMRRLIYKTGASEVNLLGLGNANVDQITFESGAGSYTLDFTGQQSRDVSVKISSGVSDIKVIVPTGVHTKVIVNGGLNNVNASGTWTINGSEYETGTTGPTILINVEMAVGNLSLSQK